MKLSLITMALIGLLTHLNAATFSSNLAEGATGNWNDVSTWTFTGSDGDGIPDENDDVNMATPNFVPITIVLTEAKSVNNLFMSGVYIDGAFNLTIKGVSATIYFSAVFTGRLVFAGTVQQTLAGANIDIFNVEINNPLHLVISGKTLISNTLTMTTGCVLLQNMDLEVTNFVGGTGFGPNGFIVTTGTGRLIQPVSEFDGNFFAPGRTFPVGVVLPSVSTFSSDNYNPLRIGQAAGSGTDKFAVRVKQGFDIDKPTGGNDYIDRQWTIDYIAGATTTVNASVRFGWYASHENANFNRASCHAARWNGSTWVATTNAAATNGGGTPIFYERLMTGITQFSPFAIGSGSTVLAAELLDFKAISHKSTVDLLWQTASEKDMSHFYIEQSTDGSTFSKIGETKAINKANSYIFTVEGPLSIRTYFRLKIVNSDGSFSYSKVLSVAFGKDLTVKAFPNPIQNELSIDVFSEAKYLDFDVVDVLGRSVFQKKEQNTEGSKLLTINTLNWLSGIYFLKVTDGKNVFQQKIVKR
jgi:Secretion system C-terminal sorting domain